MSRDLSQNERRLTALAAIGVLWGALLLAIGFAFFFVVAVIGGLLLAATAVLQGRVIVSTLEPRVRGAGAQLRGATDAASAVGGIDWSGKREALGSRASIARQLAATGSRRAVAAGGAAAAAVESRGRELAAKRAAAPAQPGRNDAMRLNERAAVLRSEERYGEALELSEQALAIYRQLDDTHGTALTLNGLGLTQARAGDEAGALDSYETAVSLLTGSATAMAPAASWRTSACSTAARGTTPRRALPGARRSNASSRARPSTTAWPSSSSSRARTLVRGVAGGEHVAGPVAPLPVGDGRLESARGVKRERSTSCSLWM